jgi:CheY-like chemotaxis protein
MRVLIAHASQTSRSQLTDVVARGCAGPLDIVTVDDGPDALEYLLLDDPPEVALVDWDLPGVEAPEMCRLVRDFHHHHDTWLVVLASSAHEDTGDVWRAGADDCVSTPASPVALCDAVAKGVQAIEAARGPAARRPTLDAICRRDEEVCEDESAGLSADLRATVDAEDLGGPAELEAGPAQLFAKRVEPDYDDGSCDEATLDAVLVRA